MQQVERQKKEYGEGSWELGGKKRAVTLIRVYQIPTGSRWDVLYKYVYIFFRCDVAVKFVFTIRYVRLYQYLQREQHDSVIRAR